MLNETEFQILHPGRKKHNSKYIQVELLAFIIHVIIQQLSMTCKCDPCNLNFPVSISLKTFLRSLNIAVFLHDQKLCLVGKFDLQEKC